MSIGQPEHAYEIEVDVDERFLDAVDPADLVRAVIVTLAHQKVPGGQVTIVIGDDEQVRELNRTYRDEDAPTDVLSFAAQEGVDLMDEVPSELAAELDAYLGDLIIALPYTRAQAASYGHPLAAELRLLAVHGTLHLLGYDHEGEEEEAAMWQAQRAILDELGDHDINWLEPAARPDDSPSPES